MTKLNAERMLHNYGYLKRLSKTRTKQQRQKILKEGGTELTKSICECVLNVLKENVPLTRDQVSKLEHHKDSLRKIADRKTSMKVKRDIINQKGGFLGPILVPVLSSLATSLLSGLIKK